MRVLDVDGREVHSAVKGEATTPARCVVGEPFFLCSQQSPMMARPCPKLPKS
jgi:hypothetical protein